MIALLISLLLTPLQQHAYGYIACDEPGHGWAQLGRDALLFACSAQDFLNQIFKQLPRCFSQHITKWLFGHAIALFVF